MRTTYLGVLLLIVVGAVLRLLDFNTWHTVGDEAIHVRLMILPSVSEFIELLAVDTHGPLFYLLGKIPLSFFTELDPVMVRLIPLFFGILAIPLSFYLGKLVSGDRAGFFSAAIVTFSIILIDASQTIRHYTLLLDLQLALLIIFFRKVYTLRTFTLFSILALGTLMTHFLAIFFVGILSLMFLFEWLKKKDLKRKKKIQLGIVVGVTLVSAWIFMFPWARLLESDYPQFGNKKAFTVVELLPYLFSIQTKLFYSDQSHFPYFMSIVTALGVVAMIREKAYGPFTLVVVPILASIFLVFYMNVSLTPDARLTYLIPGALLSVVFCVRGILTASPRYANMGIALLFILFAANILSAKPNIFEERIKKHWAITPSEFEELTKLLKENGNQVIYAGPWLKSALNMHHLIDVRAGNKNGIYSSIFKRTVLCHFKNEWTSLKNCKQKGSHEAWIVDEVTRPGYRTPVGEEGVAFDMTDTMVKVKRRRPFTMFNLYLIEITDKS